MTARGVNADAVRQAVSSTLPRRRRRPALIPFDGGAKKAIDPRIREALRLGHSIIGTEHLVLALLELEDGAGVLTGLGIGRRAPASTWSRLPP
jgi:hypothetical protein